MQMISKLCSTLSVLENEYRSVENRCTSSLRVGRGKVTRPTWSPLSSEGRGQGEGSLSLAERRGHFRARRRLKLERGRSNRPARLI